MKTIHTVSALERYVCNTRKTGMRIGLVPTMGALHAGHASLIRRSIAENEVTVVSIFVNPTQFNDKNDLANYPRTLDADCRLIGTVKSEVEAATAAARHVVVFAPSAEEIYPYPDTRHFSFPPTDSVMEGARRPGHFNGVCQIVSRLFEMTLPDCAYFGEKDFQQIAVVRAMMHAQGFTFPLVACPIVREASGLALSSRNTLLTAAERKTAAAINQTLFESQKLSHTLSVQQVRRHVVHTLNAIDGLEVEYFEIVNAGNLLPVEDWTEAAHVQGCITVYCGARPVRLIDNVRYR